MAKHFETVLLLLTGQTREVFLPKQVFYKCQMCFDAQLLISGITRVGVVLPDEADIAQYPVDGLRIIIRVSRKNKHAKNRKKKNPFHTTEV